MPLLWLYYALFESSSLRATPGKLALSLAVVDAQGERIGFWRATGRYFCRFLSFAILLIGYFMAGWTQHKQCLHDILADTYVVRKKGLDAALGYGLVGDRRPQSATASVVIGLACFFVIAGLSAAGRVGYADYAARSQFRESVSEPTKTTLEPSMPAESPAPAPAPAPMAVALVDLGSAVGPDQKVTIPTTMFTPKDTIYASVATSGIGKATIEAKWTYQDGQTVKDDSLAIAATGPANTAFSISKPDGWPAGSYKVEISLNGAAAASKDFSVK